MGSVPSRGFRRNPALDEELRQYISMRTGQVDKETGKPVTLKQAILEFAHAHGLSRHTVNARWYSLQPRQKAASGSGRSRQTPGLLTELSGFVRAVQAVEGVEILDLCRGLRVLAEKAERGQHQMEEAAQTPALVAALRDAQVSTLEMAQNQDKLLRVLAETAAMVAEFSQLPDAAKLASLADFLSRLQKGLQDVVPPASGMV